MGCGEVVDAMHMPRIIRLPDTTGTLGVSKVCSKGNDFPLKTVSRFGTF